MSNPLSQHFLQFFDKTCERVFFRDKDRKLTWANLSFFGDIVSENKSQLFGTTLAEIELEAVIAGVLGEVEEAVYQKQESQTRSQIRGSIGSSDVSVSVECHPVHSEDGVFEGLIGQYRIEDVSKNLGYEKILMDNLMKNSQDLIYFKDRDSKFTRVSDSMMQRLGVDSMEDLVKKFVMTASPIGSLHQKCHCWMKMAKSLEHLGSARTLPNSKKPSACLAKLTNS